MATPANKKWFGCVRGQGGFATSFGIDHICGLIRETGVAADVFDYGDVGAIEAVLRQRTKMGDKVGLVTYSLGGSTGEYLGTRDRIDHLISIYDSSFAIEYVLDQKLVLLSTLYHTPGALSDGSLKAGYKEVIEVPNGITVIPVLGDIVAHLEGQFSPIIVNGVLERVAKL